MKKTFFSFIILLTVFSLTACQSKKIGPDGNANLEPDTGLVIDISEKNNQTISVRPGDRVKFQLESTKGEPEQWVFEPLTTDIIYLEKQEMKNYDSAKVGEKYQTTWIFKVVKAGQTAIKLNYLDLFLKAEPKESFQVTLVGS